MLDAGTYEDLEADRAATRALVIVVLSSVAAAIGGRGLRGGSATWALLAANVEWKEQPERDPSAEGAPMSSRPNAPRGGTLAGVSAATA